MNNNIAMILVKTIPESMRERLKKSPFEYDLIYYSAFELCLVLLPGQAQLMEYLKKHYLTRNH
jgi:hypothetical protein